VIARLGAGVVLAGAIALAAYRARSLSARGAAAATAVGTISVAAGWDWGVLLVTFFLSSSLLSRFGATIKEARVSGLVAKGGARDATQVLANGGIFAASAALSLLAPWRGWAAVGAGALASAAADTWATEIGTLVGRRPRLLTTFRPVSTGVSGGVTAAGLLASGAGALFMASIAWLLHWPAPVAMAAFVGGVTGALADSLVGALWQSRRRCPHCDAATERRVHTCGTTTLPAGGLAWLNNDSVNVIGSAVGAVVALLAFL
jgi:uncharacterized protein (TIGR00297 family)